MVFESYEYLPDYMHYIIKSYLKVSSLIYN